MSAPFLLLIALFVGLSVARVPVAFAMLAASIGYLVAGGRDVGLVADQVLNSLYNS